MILIKNLVIIIPLFLFSLEGLTARHSDAVQKDLVLPASCSQELAKVLKLKPSSKSQTLKFKMNFFALKNGSNVSVIVENTLEMNEAGIISMGPHFWDRTGAIPRDAGLRYQMSFNPKPYNSALPEPWDIIDSYLSDKKSKTLKLCEDKTFGLTIGLFEREKIVNQYGSIPSLKIIYIQLGESVEEIKPTPGKH